MESLFKNIAKSGESAVLNAGHSLKWRRVFKDGFLVLKNKGPAQCKVTVLWLNDLYAYEGESQFILEIAPGSTVEFEPPQNQCADQFLDTIVLDLISGDCLEVSCMIPLELLN